MDQFDFNHLSYILFLMKNKLSLRHVPYILLSMCQFFNSACEICGICLH